MRKFTLILISAVVLSIMAVPAFAVDTSECDQFKKGEDNYQPGLYGLCVAYQNADEDGKEDIFDNWNKKVGDDGLPKLPGYPYPPDDAELACPEDQDFCCPCWSDLQLVDICPMGVPTTVNLAENATVEFFNFDTMYIDTFYLVEETEPASCTYVNQEIYFDATGLVFYPSEFVDIPDLNSVESAYCRAEIEAIAAMYMSALCNP